MWLSGTGLVFRASTLVLLRGAFPGWGTAAEVYRWVDSAGVTHFSDAAPPADAAEVSSLTFEARPAPSPADDYYSIGNQTRRLEASRRELEQVRLEQEAARADRQRSLAEAEQAAAEARLAAARAQLQRSDDTGSRPYLPAYPRGHAGARPRPHPPAGGIKPGESVITRSIARPRYEMVYGQRRFAGYERITVQEGIAAPGLD
jgi:hypothetical protein